MGTSPRFAVYVAGIPVPPEDFVRRLAGEGVPEDKARSILGKVPCPVKRNAPLEVAQRFQAMFRRAGAIVDVMPEPFVQPEPFAPVPETPGDERLGTDSRGSFIMAVPRSVIVTPPDLEDGVPRVGLSPSMAVDAVLELGDDRFAPPPPDTISVADLPDAAPPRVRPRVTLTPVLLPPQASVVHHGSITERLSKVPPYLMRPGTLMVLLGGAVVGPLGSWVAWRIPLAGLVLGPLWAIGVQAILFFRIIETSAYDEEELTPPDFRTWWEDLFLPALRYIAVFMPVLFGFAYLGTGAILQMAQGRPPWRLLVAEPLMMVLVLIGFALVPLLAAITAIARSVLSAYNPVRWYDALRAMGLEYAVAAAAFYGLYITEAIATYLVGATPIVRIPVLGLVLVNVPAYFFMAARARVLGALIQPHVDR